MFSTVDSPRFFCRVDRRDVLSPSGVVFRYGGKDLPAQKGVSGGGGWGRFWGWTPTPTGVSDSLPLQVCAPPYPDENVLSSGLYPCCSLPEMFFPDNLLTFCLFLLDPNSNAAVSPRCT